MANSDDNDKLTVNITPDGQALDRQFVQGFEYELRKLRDLHQPFSLSNIHGLLASFNVVWAAGQRGEQQMQQLFDRIMKAISRRSDFENARGDDGYLYDIGDKLEFNAGKPGAKYIGIPGIVTERWEDDDGQKSYYIKPLVPQERAYFLRQEVDLYLDQLGPEED